MHKKAFVSISYRYKDKLSREVRTICNALRQLQIEAIVFVHKYSFAPRQEKDMMKKAMEEIQTCDLLIAEVSEKAIGVGIEIGYARGLGKPIIYLRKEDTEYSTTVGGLSDHQIVYRYPKQLKVRLVEVIKNLPFADSQSA